MHAQGEDEAFVQAALEGGFGEIGFADHGPWPFPDGFVSRSRMTCPQLPGYIASLQELKRRYADRIRVRIGLESEYYPCYRDHMLREKDAGIEYFILGQHNVEPENVCPYVPSVSRDDEVVLRYADAVVKGICTGLFTYVAHPDLFMGPRRAPEDFTRACEEAADMICQAAREQGMPLEYNLLGLMNEMDGCPRGYPSAPFWEYARKHHNDVILGVDAHIPLALTRFDVWQEGVHRLETLGYNRIEVPVFPD